MTGVLWAEEVWEELESRAGASDTDREAWLAERRGGVTATEIRDLAKAGDLNNAMAYLVKQKVTGSGDNFRGNAYTEWGNERELAMGALAEIEYGFIHETRVFHHAEFPQWLASPDGIRVRDDLGITLLEIKTGGYPLTFDAAVHRGYYDQCQWQMLVLGADETLLMWEERIEGENGFEVGRRGVIPIEASASRQEHLASIADRFLEALREATEEGLPETSDEDPYLADLVFDLMAKRRDVEVAEEFLREYLDLFSITAAATPVGKLSYTWGKPRRTFDREAFEVAYPGVYETFLKDGAPPEKQTLRITAPKDKQDAAG